MRQRRLPWSGEPVSADSLTLYEGKVVGFCNTGCRDKFEAATRAFDAEIEGKQLMADLHFELVTPDRLVMSDDVYMVVVPGTEGESGIMAGHAPYMTTLRERRDRGLPHAGRASPSASR